MEINFPNNDVPSCIAIQRNSRFHVERTCADGACAIHSVFGSPSSRGLLKPGARHFYSHQLGSSCQELAANMNDDTLLEEFCHTLWYDVVKPQVQSAAGLEASAVNLGPEERAIFRAIKADAVALQNCTARVRLEQQQYQNFQTQRDELERRFCFLCHRDHEYIFYACCFFR